MLTDSELREAYVKAHTDWVCASPRTSEGKQALLRKIELIEEMGRRGFAPGQCDPNKPKFNIETYQPKVQNAVPVNSSNDNTLDVDGDKSGSRRGVVRTGKRKARDPYRDPNQTTLFETAP